jgi:hypothetical protein
MIFSARDPIYGISPNFKIAGLLDWHKCFNHLKRAFKSFPALPVSAPLNLQHLTILAIHDDCNFLSLGGFKSEVQHLDFNE